MRNYKKEYKKFQSKDWQKKDRAKRNKARTDLAKKGLVSKGDGKDVHHVNGINNKELKVMSSSKNKGMPNEGGRKRGVKKRKYVK